MKENSLNLGLLYVYYLCSRSQTESKYYKIYSTSARFSNIMNDFVPRVQVRKNW